MSNYDVVVQVRQSAIESVLRAQHANGVMDHARSLVDQTGASRLSLGAPRLALEPSPADGEPTIRASLGFRALYADVGPNFSSAVSRPLHLAVQASVAAEPQANPFRIADVARLRLKWDLATNNVVEVNGLPPSPTVTNRVTRMMNGWTGTYPLPDVSGLDVQWMGHKVVMHQTGEPSLAIGLSGDPATPTFPPLSAPIHDWSIQLSSAFLLARVEDGLRAFFAGSLPPPHGPEPVELAGQEMTWLDFSWDGAKIRVQTLLEVPGATVDLRFAIELSLASGDIRATVTDIEASIDYDLLGAVLNALSFGAIESLIREKIEGALRSDGIAGGFGGLFSERLLSTFASGGLLGRVRVEPRIVGLRAGQSGLTLDGTLQLPSASYSPQASLQVSVLPPVDPAVLAGQVDRTPVQEAAVSSGPSFARGPGAAVASTGGPSTTSMARGSQISIGRSATGAPSLASTPSEPVRTTIRTETASPLRRSTPALGLGRPTLGPAFALPTSGVTLAASPHTGISLNPGRGSSRTASPRWKWPVLLDASRSWSPGADIARVQWNFGDGSQAVGVGVGMRSLALHQYPAGSYAASVTIVDSQGRTSTAQQRIAVGGLSIRHLPEPEGLAWHLCHTGMAKIRIAVTTDATPVSGATLELKGDGWSEVATTDSSGFGEFSIDLSAADLIPPVRTSPILVGNLKVTAQRTGFVPASEQLLWVVDCTIDAVANFPPADVFAMGSELEAILRGPLAGDPAGGRAGQIPGAGPRGSGPEVGGAPLSRALDIVADLRAIAAFGGAHVAGAHEAATDVLKSMGLWAQTLPMDHGRREPADAALDERIAPNSGRLR